MKRLVVMRHAKSDWEAGAGSDHERPLNDRGRREAPSVGRELAERGYTPDVVLTSDSKRTTETLELAKPFWPKAKVVAMRALYHAGIVEVRDALPSVPADAVTLLVLGHNPGWEGMVSQLSGKHVEMKTSYAAVLESEADSFDAALAPGAKLKLVAMIKPHG
jgi:phosphohistidine phosphatase